MTDHVPQEPALWNGLNTDEKGSGASTAVRSFPSTLPLLPVGASDSLVGRRTRPSPLERQRHRQLPAIAESPAHFLPLEEEYSDDEEIRRSTNGKKFGAALPPISERTARSESAASSNSVSSSRTAGSLKAGSTKSSRKGSRRGSRRSSSVRGGSVLSHGKLKGLLNRLRPLQERTQGEPYRRFQRYGRGVAAFVSLVRYNMEKNSKWTQQYLNPDVMKAMEEDKNDLLFDVNFFRSSKESRIPKEGVRILLKDPSTRTEHEIHYIMVMQRAYPELAEYPLFMQKMIAERARYQSYEEKRLITREGQPAVAFYYILSGSAIETMYDQRTNTNKPVGTLLRGSMFGDDAIVRGTKREKSVLSKDSIELLSLADSDYLDIFMSRGQKEANENFLRSLGYMQDWPVEIVSDHPKKVVFAYFKRGSVMVSDSNNSDWLYIVKSGSVNVLKKLRNCAALEDSKRKRPCIALGCKDRVVPDMESYQKAIAHNECVLLTRARMNPDKVRSLSYYTPEINVALNDVLHVIAATPAAAATKYTRASLSAAKKMPFDTTGETDENVEAIDAAETRPENGKHADVEQSLVLTADELSEREQKSNVADVFVVTQVLSRGSVFGLIQGYASNITHPSFNVVSNGAECIMVQKKFYFEHAPDSLLNKLREEMFPYPSDTELQEKLCITLSWAKYRKVMMKDELARVKSLSASATS